VTRSSMAARLVAVSIGLGLSMGCTTGSQVGERAGASSASRTPVAGPVDAPQRPRGYLGAEGVPDHEVFVPPPPSAGSPLGIADVAIFRATRALEDGPRWRLAARDNEIGRRALLGDYACALGVDLAVSDAPAIARVVARANADLFPVVGAAKDLYARPRPFLTEPGPVCITYSEAFARSGSYPSGHAAAGWLYALLLAQIAPERAAEILERGRAFGESRVVCGVHYATDIEAGRMTSDSVFAALQGNPEFQGDIAAARAELAVLRASPARPDAASCAADALLLDSPY
jgi:acid phosphatase (class A)